MEVVLERNSQELTQGTDTVEELHARALREPCALKAELWLSEILFSPGDDRLKAEVILDIVTRRADFPSVQLRAFQDLKALDPDTARKFVLQIVQEPLHEDRDHIRARALATLVELPAITPGEALLLADGLKCRFRTVAYAVTHAIGSLSRADLSAIGEAAAQWKGTEAIKVAPLVAALKEAYQDAPTRSVIEALEDEKEHEKLVSPKQPRPESALVPAAKRVSRAIFRPAPASSKAAIDSQAVETNARVPRVSPSPTSVVRPLEAPSTQAPTTQAQSMAPISLPPRPVVSTAPASLDALRDPKLLDKTWQELLFERDRQKDPRKLCACIAEMLARFGAELTRDAASSSLIYVVSHSDPELKRMGEVLVDRLFRAK
jgi:hypothetical protein